jgi:hypothetical protein
MAMSTLLGCFYLLVFPVMGGLHIYWKLKGKNPIDEFLSVIDRVRRANANRRVRQQKRTFQRALNRWAKEFPSSDPVEALYYGELSRPAFKSPMWGVLGIVENRLVYLSIKGPTDWIELSEIRWICHQNMSTQARDTFPTHEALTLHCELNGRWEVYVFTTPGAEHLAQVIHAQTQAHYQPRYFIGGPIQVRYKHQDLYGQWGEEDSTRLYLAPDRLLSQWHSWIELKQIQHWGLMPDNTIQLTYLSDRLHVVSLDLGYAQTNIWVDLLERATGLPMENLAGRKKKSDVE